MCLVCALDLTVGMPDLVLVMYQVVSKAACTIIISQVQQICEAPAAQDVEGGVSPKICLTYAVAEKKFIWLSATV